MERSQVNIIQYIQKIYKYLFAMANTSLSLVGRYELLINNN